MPTAQPPATQPPSRRGDLVLRPFRATRPTADGTALATLLCPPYDVIDAATKTALLSADADNFVAVAVPEPTAAGYRQAAQMLSDRLTRSVLAVDDVPALYVYEMASADGQVTRGLVGAVELRDPAEGVILPHEDTMAGPVADRLALMAATEADLEPIYLLYDGGGTASLTVQHIDDRLPLTETVTGDGTRHRLWAITDQDTIAAVATDLSGRRALIADGHHRYATYRERQRTATPDAGAGPWDRGLTLLVDSTAYGPRVHPIHRVITELSLTDALERIPDSCEVRPLAGDGETDSSRGERPANEELADATAQALAEGSVFAVVLTDGSRSVVVRDSGGALRAAARRVAEPPELADLDVSVLHRVLIDQMWAVPDDVDHVGYAHTVDEAVNLARGARGVAVLLRATPAAAVAAVAAAGARMPRKSTLFTPKPASGLVLRRLADEPSE